MGGVRYWHLSAEASKAERFRLCPNFRQPFARSMEEVMSRSLAFVVGYAVVLVLLLLPQPRQLNSALQRKPRPCSIGQLPR
jgi:hypothetical protein